MTCTVKGDIACVSARTTRSRRKRWGPEPPVVTVKGALLVNGDGTGH